MGKKQLRRLRRDLRLARLEARTDALTGLGNRRRWDELVARWTSKGRPFAFVLFDLANLKAANAALGHFGADEVLAAVAATIRADQDLALRIGGDEFAALLEGATLEEARRVRDRVEVAVDILDIGFDVWIFLSGEAGRWEPGDHLLDCLLEADRGLERRKAAKKLAMGLPTTREEVLERWN